MDCSARCLPESCAKTVRLGWRRAAVRRSEHVSKGLRTASPRCGGVVAPRLEDLLFPLFFCLSAPSILVSLGRADTLFEAVTVPSDPDRGADRARARDRKGPRHRRSPSARARCPCAGRALPPPTSRRPRRCSGRCYSERLRPRVLLSYMGMAGWLGVRS